MTTQPEDERRSLPGRPWWWAAAALAGALVVAFLVWLGLDGEGNEPASGAEEGETALPSVDGFGSPVGTPKPGQTEPEPAELPSTTPRPVRTPLGEVAEIGGGVTAHVIRFESVQGEATGAGERDAPAVRFTIEITNGTSSEIDLRATTVTAYIGPSLDPAPDIGAPGVRLFPASAAPGTTARGAFVFAIPPNRRDDVTVHVGYRAEAPTAIFRGSVP